MLRRSGKGAAILAGATCVALTLTACGGGGGGGGAGGPGHKGGTLTVVGKDDVDHLDTAAGYYNVTYGLFRAVTRQLFTYRTDKDFKKENKPVPDLATEVPTKDNGGISADGTTYTVKLKKGVKWNTDPAREVTAKDVLRGFKRLCNPSSPVGAPGYYNDTIVGFKDYCDGELKVDAKAGAIADYMKGHEIKGITVKDDRTVQFKLTQPASDFVNILAMMFSSPAPKEYLKYVPDSPELHKNFISDGPYQIKSYTPNRGFTLVRNKAWDPDTDDVRKAYVDKIKIKEGVDQKSVQQQLETGAADVSWDQPPPPAKLPQLIQRDDPNLLIGPPGDNYLSINPYMVINQIHKGPLQKLKVRQALEYAVNKNSAADVYGGPKVAKPLQQIIPGGNIGHVDGFNPYPDNNGKGNPKKAKQLLKEAGYPDGITLKMVYRSAGVHPKMSQTIAASLKRAGIKVDLVAATGDDFYTKYLENPSATKRGVWDIATPGWIPDWAGNNGRSVIEPLFDGRTYGPNSNDYGGYNSETVNKAIDKALSSSSEKVANKAWQTAAKQIMKDAAAVPINKQKFAWYHSDDVQNCIYSVQNNNCDFTNVWLKE